MMGHKEKLKSGLELDVIYQKQILCYLKNYPGIVRYVKRSMNKRTRQKAKKDLHKRNEFEGENFIRIGEEPNAETLKAISEINQGKGKRHKTVDSLMSDLMTD